MPVYMLRDKRLQMLIAEYPPRISYVEFMRKAIHEPGAKSDGLSMEEYKHQRCS